MIALSAVDDLERLVEEAHTSELFSSPHLEADLGRFFAGDAERLRELARESRRSGVEQVYFVGSGGSWASMYSGKYLCDRLGGPASDVSLSYELVWRAPARLDSNALVFLASYSGATEDTLAALQFAKSRGARTVALVNRAETPIGDQADVTIAYASPGLYCLPMAAVTAFACEWAAARGSTEAAALAERLSDLPAQVGRAYRDGRALGRERAAAVAGSDLVYCVGAGPLYGLAYKFGLTVFMENMRIHSSVVETAEFRHGPAEMLDRHAPDMAVLVGTDESRAMSERMLRLAGQRGARTLVFDAADHAGTHPLLAPFVLKVDLQWFIVYSTLMRGIHDLDERAFMGHHVLAEGGASWP
jgi:fructoselysine-6-P-deglycase FrlB-like protein